MASNPYGWKWQLGCPCCGPPQYVNQVADLIRISKATGETLQFKGLHKNIIRKDPQVWIRPYPSQYLHTDIIKVDNKIYVCGIGGRDVDSNRWVKVLHCLDAGDFSTIWSVFLDGTSDDSSQTRSDFGQMVNSIGYDSSDDTIVAICATSSEGFTIQIIPSGMYGFTGIHLRKFSASTGELIQVGPNLPSSVTVATSFTITLPTYSGTQNSLFQIIDNQLFLVPGVDFETRKSYELVFLIEGFDENGSSIGSNYTPFSLVVRNISEGTPDIILSDVWMSEDILQNEIVAKLSVGDPASGKTYDFFLVPGGKDNSEFTVDGTTLRRSSNAPYLDYRVKRLYSILLRMVDSDNNRVEKAFSIGIKRTISSNQFNTFNRFDLELDNIQIEDGSGPNSFVANLTPKQSNTKRILGSAQNTIFEVDGGLISVYLSPDFDVGFYTGLTIFDGTTLEYISGVQQGGLAPPGTSGVQGISMPREGTFVVNTYYRPQAIGEQPALKVYSLYDGSLVSTTPMIPPYGMSSSNPFSSNPILQAVRPIARDDDYYIGSGGPLELGHIVRFYIPQHFYYRNPSFVMDDWTFDLTLDGTATINMFSSLPTSWGPITLEDQIKDAAITLGYPNLTVNVTAFQLELGPYPSYAFRTWFDIVIFTNTGSTSNPPSVSVTPNGVNPAGESQWRNFVVAGGPAAGTYTAPFITVGTYPKRNTATGNIDEESFDEPYPRDVHILKGSNVSRFDLDLQSSPLLANFPGTPQPTIFLSNPTVQGSPTSYGKDQNIVVRAATALAYPTRVSTLLPVPSGGTFRMLYGTESSDDIDYNQILADTAGELLGKLYNILDGSFPTLGYGDIVFVVHELQQEIGQTYHWVIAHQYSRNLLNNPNAKTLTFDFSNLKYSQLGGSFMYIVEDQGVPKVGNHSPGITYFDINLNPLWTREQKEVLGLNRISYLRNWIDTPADLIILNSSPGSIGPYFFR